MVAMASCGSPGTFASAADNTPVPAAAVAVASAMAMMAIASILVVFNKIANRVLNTR
jgi:hypothetical protein